MSTSAASTAPGRPIQLTPVAPQERVQLLDVLRGVCLFGVLWSNLNDHYGPADPVTSLDRALAWAQGWLVEERFYSMLGFLFGIGFAIQLMRAEERGADVRSMFYLRMAALLGIGVIHGVLIWHGDILTTYALLGFLLVPFRKLSPGKLLVAASVVWLAVPYFVVRISALLHLHWPTFPFDEANSIYASGTWPQILLQGARQYLWWHGRWPLFIYPSFLALFLFGLWAMRVNLVRRFTRRRKYLMYALAGALACWGAGVYLCTELPQPPLPGTGMPAWQQASFWMPMDVVFRFCDRLATWANSASYALLFAIALSFPGLSTLLRPLASLGRMTLTTYLTQSVICTALFYGWGCGLFGKVGYSGMLLITVGLFSLQLASSVWWLRRYRFGPAEWLWRSVSYGKKQPMRITAG